MIRFRRNGPKAVKGKEGGVGELNLIGPFIQFSPFNGAICLQCAMFDNCFVSREIHTVRRKCIIMLYLCLINIRIFI